MKVNFNSNIRVLRKDFNISQLRLAKETGLGKSAISCWEIGTDTPNAKEIIVLSRYFQVTTDYLLKLNDDNTPVYHSDNFDCDMTLFNKRLKELRIKNKLSQLQLSKILKISQAAINYWEIGKRTPNAQSIIALASYFKVTTDFLLGESD